MLHHTAHRSLHRRINRKLSMCMSSSICELKSCRCEIVDGTRGVRCACNSEGLQFGSEGFDAGHNLAVGCTVGTLWRHHPSGSEWDSCTRTMVCGMSCTWVQVCAARDALRYHAVDVLVVHGQTRWVAGGRDAFGDTFRLGWIEWDCNTIGAFRRHHGLWDVLHLHCSWAPWSTGGRDAFSDTIRLGHAAKCFTFLQEEAFR